MKTEVKANDGVKNYLPFPFSGFWNKGFCRLKVFSKNGKIVFLCSQLIDYHGTSITNAVEAIKEAAINQLLQDEILTVRIHLNFFEKLTKSDKEITSYKNTAVTEYINNNSIWIEHYPSDTEIHEYESYSIVSFSANGEPSWSYLTKEMIANELVGIDLDVPIEELKAWQR